MPRAVGLNAVGDLDGRRPSARFVARNPDADIGMFLARTTEPGGDEMTGGGLFDGRGMAFGERRGLVDEPGFQEAGLGAEWLGAEGREG